MKIFFLKNFFVYSLLLIFFVPFVYAQEFTEWLDPDHCTVHYLNLDWDNYGQCSGACDMMIGEYTYVYRGLIYFPLTYIPINSIITNHSEIPIKCTEQYPQSETWYIKAVPIEKDPKVTSASDVYTDCADGAAYKTLEFWPSHMRDIISANKLKSKMQSNLENGKNWIAVGFYTTEPVSGYNYEFDDNYLSVDYIVVDIYNVQVTNITNNSARITWSTNPNSWTYLRYKKKNISSDPWQEYTNENFTSNHIVNLSGLSADTEYEYKIGIRLQEYDHLNKAAYKSTFKTEKIRTITVISPNGGNLILQNSNFNITWSSQNVEHNVKIELSSNGGHTWSTVVDNLPNSGSYNWITPNIVSDNCKIKISDITGFPKDESDGTFTIHTITTSGILPTSERWSNSVYITGNVTVPTSKTLFVGPGNSVFVANGVKLTINGTFDARQTTFQSSSGTWYGIEFTNASYHSMIRYCTIKNATVGVHMNNTDVYLGSNVIKNNTTGLLFNSGSDGTSNSNEITFNSSCGIKCTNNSDPLLFSCNIISDNGYGLAGIFGDGSSVFDLGRYSDQGHNSIYYNDPYEVQSSYSGTIYARYNWWGDPDPDPNIYNPNGTIDWSYYLTSNPNTMLEKTISEQPASDTPIMKTAALKDTLGISEVDYAYLIYRKGDFQTAATLFETIVHKYPTHFSGRRALAFLYKCNKHLNKGSENLTLLDDISSTYTNEEIDALAKNIAAGELIKQGDYYTAIAKSKAVTNFFAETAYSKQALFNLGSVYWYFLNDPKTGEIYYRQLIAAYPDDDLSISALATLGEWRPDEPKQEQQPLAEHPEMGKFSLDQNYPNPFNPETTIRYHIAEVSLVTIKIYNILGEEVITLVDQTQLQGNHAIQWYGQDKFGNIVSNGVYWMRMQAGKFVGQRKLVLLR